MIEASQIAALERWLAENRGRRLDHRRHNALHATGADGSRWRAAVADRHLRSRAAQGNRV